MSSTRKSFQNVSDENVQVFTWRPHALVEEEALLERIKTRAQSGQLFSKGIEFTGIAIEDAVLLDAGCGAGLKALPLAHKFRAVVGVDGSEVQLARANRLREQLGFENTKFVQGRLEDLDEICENVGVGPFDVILCSQVIHHVAGWRETICHFSSLLKMDGHLILTWMDPTIGLASFILKNHIAYKLGRDRESRLRLGRFLFGWWDKRRNVMNLDAESFFADLYSAYYIPITIWRMKRELAAAGLTITQSFPPYTLAQLIENRKGYPGGVMRQLLNDRLLLAIGRFPVIGAVLNTIVLARTFFRFGHGQRTVVCHRPVTPR